MKDLLCVRKDGGGCKHCVLVHHWSQLKCRMNKWDLPKGYIQLCNFDWKDEKTISPRPRKLFKLAEHCDYYEEV